MSCLPNVAHNGQLLSVPPHPHNRIIHLENRVRHKRERDARVVALDTRVLDSKSYAAAAVCSSSYTLKPPHLARPCSAPLHTLPACRDARPGCSTPSRCAPPGLSLLRVAQMPPACSRTSIVIIHVLSFLFPDEPPIAQGLHTHLLRVVAHAVTLPCVASPRSNDKSSHVLQSKLPARRLLSSLPSAPLLAPHSPLPAPHHPTPCVPRGTPCATASLTVYHCMSRASGSPSTPPIPPCPMPCQARMSCTAVLKDAAPSFCHTLTHTRFSPVLSHTLHCSVHLSHASTPPVQFIHAPLSSISLSPFPRCT
jgi:hypothetical protein